MVQTKLVIKFDAKELMSECRACLSDTVCYDYGFVVRGFVSPYWYLDTPNQFNQADLRAYLNSVLSHATYQIWLSPFDTVYDYETKSVRLNYGAGYQWMPVINMPAESRKNFAPSVYEWWFDDIPVIKR